MHGCDDKDVMVFKLVERLRGFEYYNSLPTEIRSQFSTICTLFEGRFGPQETPATTRSNLNTINQRVYIDIGGSRILLEGGQIFKNYI